MKNMNSDRALFLILWTLAATFVVLFAAGWTENAWSVFWPSTYNSLSDYVVFWAVILAPYPIVLFAPRIRKG